MFIVEHFQVVVHSHNSHVWILKKAIVICKPWPPLDPSLQHLTILGCRFTSSPLCWQPWQSPIVGWRTFSKSNGYDCSKMERLNGQQHCAFCDVPSMFIHIWQFELLSFSDNCQCLNNHTNNVNIKKISIWWKPLKFYFPLGRLLPDFLIILLTKLCPKKSMCITLLSIYEPLIILTCAYEY
jgi:hypothetical protein